MAKYNCPDNISATFYKQGELDHTETQSETQRITSCNTVPI